MLAQNIARSRGRRGIREPKQKEPRNPFPARNLMVPLTTRQGTGSKDNAISRQ